MPGVKNFQKQTWSKDMARHTQAKRIVNHQNWMTRNVIRSPSRKRKMLTNGNVDPHTEMKITGHSNCMDKSIRFFPYYLNIFKGSWMFKQK